jgi:hypothetical protein
MKTLELTGTVDDKGILHASVPAEIRPGTVRFVAQFSDEADYEFSDAWMKAIPQVWADELSDPRDDIYTLEDGEPVNGSR